MGRFFLTVLVGVAIFVGVAWYFELWTQADTTAPGPRKGSKATASKVDVGEPLYLAWKPKPTPVIDVPRRVDPIAVIGGHLALVDKSELAAEVEGTILFIGEEVPDAVIAAAGVAPFMVDPYRFATMNMGDGMVSKFYRRVQQGEVVSQDQIVAMLNPAKSLHDVTTKRARLEAAIAELKAAEFLADESRSRMVTAERLYPGAISREDRDAAILTFNKYYQEKIKVGAGIKVAQAELGVSEHILRQHEIRNKILLPKSKIQAIYKNSGDAIKASEPIMQVVNAEYLQAEGMVDAPLRDKILQARRVILEPSQEETPAARLEAHRGEITSVAITRDGKVVSASEDSTVRVWSRPEPVDRDGKLIKEGRPWTYSRPRLLYDLPHADAVKVVACSPPRSKKNWCIAGCGNGNIYIWNLDRPNDRPVILSKPHTNAVTSLAFSPDGTWFASGDDGKLICVWKTEGKLVDDKIVHLEYPFEAAYGVDQPHQGSITSLHFTPQTKLVSASRDGTVRVWGLYEKGARLERREEGRKGNVSRLDVDRGGKHMLFDKLGKELQILDVDTGRYVCSLQNPQGAIPFQTLALFSPDASLLLTAGAAEGRLQLWQTPTEHKRGFEVRQLVTGDRADTTCAAFDHRAGIDQDGDGSFAVSGTKDGYVYVWAVPNKTDVKNHPRFATRRPLLAPSQDNTQQIRLSVELRNPVDDLHPDGRFTPGRPVTIVIE